MMCEVNAKCSKMTPSQESPSRGSCLGEGLRRRNTPDRGWTFGPGEIIIPSFPSTSNVSKRVCELNWNFQAADIPHVGVQI